MKIVLWIVASAAIVVVVVAVVGAMLPVRHHATRRARYHAPPERIYALLSGPPDWRPGVKKFGALPDEGGRKRWWEEDAHRNKITFELVEAQPPARLQTRIADRALPFGGTWTFDIAPADGGGADVRIAEDGEVYNVIFRFMSRFIFGHHAGIETYLKDLGAKLGEPVRIEA
jgi:hypothetical protein